MTKKRYLTVLLTGDIQDTANNEFLRGSGIAKRLNELDSENKTLKKENEELNQKYDKVVKFIRRNHAVGMIHRILKGE